MCQPSKLFNETCSGTMSSYMCQTLTQATICNNSGTQYLCQCPYMQYYDPFSNKCKYQQTLNMYCDLSINDMCQTMFGLVCLTGVCKYIFIGINQDYYNLFKNQIFLKS